VKKAPTSQHTNQLVKDYTCCKSKYKEKDVEDKWEEENKEIQRKIEKGKEGAPHIGLK
jgi:hypothetical protein